MKRFSIALLLIFILSSAALDEAQFSDIGFKKEWGDRCPVVIVPTKYYTTNTDVFRNAGFSLIIWANMLLRSSIKALQQTATQLYKEESLHSVEDNIAPLSELTVNAIKKNGENILFDVIVRLDNKVDLEYYQNLGILHTVLRKMLNS